MDVHVLQAAQSGANLGFIEDYSDQYRQPVESKATTFFREHFKKDDAIIHDREYPQPPPHRYLPGAPSPLHYGVPLSDGYDAGVFAVSSALFAGSGAFTAIPIQLKPVFRRRQRGDSLPEWSNAFVTRVDPCECVNPEETYTPYEVARYEDPQGVVRTTLDFRT